MANMTIEEIGKSGRAYAFLTGHKTTMEEAKRYAYPMTQHVSRKDVGDDAFLRFAAETMANYCIDVDDCVFFGDCWYDIRDKNTFGEFITGQRILLFLGHEDIALFQSEISETILEPLDTIFAKYGSTLAKINYKGERPLTSIISERLLVSTVISDFYNEIIRLSFGAMDSPKAKYPNFVLTVNDRYNKLIGMVEDEYGSCILERDAIKIGIDKMMK